MVTEEAAVEKKKKAVVRLMLSTGSEASVSVSGKWQGSVQVTYRKVQTLGCVYHLA